MEEAGSLAGEAASLSGNTEVLAGEAAAENVNSVSGVFVDSGAMYGCATNPGMHSPGLLCVRWWFHANTSYVVVDGDSGPPCREHLPAPRILLTEEDVSKPSSVESVVEAADPAEDAADTKTSGPSVPPRFSDFAACNVGATSCESAIRLLIGSDIHRFPFELTAARTPSPCAATG